MFRPRTRRQSDVARSETAHASASVADFVRFVRELFCEPTATIPLHAPTLGGLEKEKVLEAIDSTYVSSVGAFVGEFEQAVAQFTGARYAVATVNGTAALHLALHVAGVRPGDEVITQSLTFVATCNAMRYCGADPVFVDVDEDTLGMSPDALRHFLERHAQPRADGCYNRTTGRPIRACVPMHTLGHPARIDAIAEVCAEFALTLVEDAAEALGSRYHGRHAGTFGKLGVFSFNGNKIITTGGGGMIVTDDEVLAARAKHLSTTAKLPHPWAFEHDEVGFNYRLPNLNAALGVAQMARLPALLARKRDLAERYAQWMAAHGWSFIREPVGAVSNYWLNGVLVSGRTDRDEFLGEATRAGVMCRPLWMPLHRLDPYGACQRGSLAVTDRLADRVVNLPSSPLPV